MLVGIIGAMDLEVQALKGLMDNAVVETISTIDFYKGCPITVKCFFV